MELLVEGLAWMFSSTLQRPIAKREMKLEMIQGQPLAPRLQRLLDCLILGKTEKQVARELRLTRNTVHTYVKELYRVLDVTSRGELFAKAYLHAKDDPAKPGPRVPPPLIIR
jgi:DNA-binding NarL/FixJ family response regulator